MQEEYDSQPGSPGPSKKRRYSRVSRACNECRVRKIRCNGRQPCEPCEDFERHCTFTSTKGQKMTGAPRTKILEDRLRRARALIIRLQSQNPSVALAFEVNSIFDSPPGSPSSVSDTTGITDETPAEHLESMMAGKGHLLLNTGPATYYGGGSGLLFLQKTLQLFSQNSPLQKMISNEPIQPALSALFDSALRENSTSQIDLSSLGRLPSRATVMELLEVYFGTVYPLIQFLHEPTFRRQVDRILDFDPMDYEEMDHDFLPLFHSVMALGFLFHHKIHQKYSCEESMDQAMRHFTAARQMIQIDRCRELLGLQSMVCLALFLLSTSRLTTAHSLIALSVSACMRMGLHSQTSCNGVTPLLRELKIRVFWTVVKLDIYSSIILGLPMMINLTFVDQAKPSGFSRDYSDEATGGFSSITSRRIFAASAQYLQLLIILRRLVKRFYPKTDQEADNAHSSKQFAASNATVDEIREQFKIWRDGLADALGLSEGQDGLSSLIYELEMAHNCGHLLLYQPYLHYLTRTKDENPPDPRLLHCATSCVRISRLVIIRSEEMFLQGFLAPASWQSIYIIFLSLVTLIYFLLTQHGNKEYSAIHKEAERGIRILHGISCLDTGARRCLDALKLLITGQSHLTDLNVDELSEGMKSLCQANVYDPNARQNSRLNHFQQPHEISTPTGRDDMIGNLHTIPQVVSSNRPFVSHSQTYSGPAAVGNFNSVPLPLYQSQNIPYSTPIPVWDQTTTILTSDQDALFPDSVLHFQATPKRH